MGINAAWQKTLKFEEFNFGKVNRAVSLQECASGKGINSARAVKCWNKNVKGDIFQFYGGDAGNKIIRYLDDYGIKHYGLKVKNPTRTCTTVLCSKTSKMTELIEPSGKISEEESNQLLKLCLEKMPEYDAVAICGTYPPGITDAFYASIAKCANENGIPVLLDACKNIDDTLKERIDYLKINVEEILALSGQKEIKSAIKYCFDNFNIANIAITNESQPAILASKDFIEYFDIPKLDEIINPLGCGDTVNAVFLAEIVNGKNISDAFKSGLNAGTANCLSNNPGEF